MSRRTRLTVLYEDSLGPNREGEYPLHDLVLVAAAEHGGGGAR